MSHNLQLACTVCTLVATCIFAQRTLFLFPSLPLFRYFNFTPPMEHNCIATRNEWDNTGGLMTVIVAIQGGATLFGFLTSPLLVETIGRSVTLFWVTCPIAALSCLLQTISKFANSHVPTFLTAIFFNGLAEGLLTVSMVTFLVETSGQQYRAVTGGLLNVAVFAGTTMGQGLLLTSDDNNWWGSLPLFLTAAYILGFGYGFYAPDSPKHLLLTRDHTERAYESVVYYKVSRDTEASETFHEIRGEEPTEESPRLARLGFCSHPTNTRSLQSAISLGILYYIAQLYIADLESNNAIHALGLGACESRLLCAVFSMTNTLMALICLALIYNFRRRKLLIIGSIVFLVSSFIFFVIDVVRRWDHRRAFLCTPLLLIAQFCFGIGPGGLPLTIITEISPQSVRSMILAAALFCGHMLNLGVQMLLFEIKLDINSWIFLVYSICLVLAILHTFISLPETKDRQMNDLLANWEYETHSLNCCRPGWMREAVPLRRRTARRSEAGQKKKKKNAQRELSTRGSIVSFGQTSYRSI